MKIDAFTQLFSQKSANAQSTNPRAGEATAAQSSAEASEAVSVSSSIAQPDARAARVAQLKEQVANNSYKPDREAVASAVYRELFA